MLPELSLCRSGERAFLTVNAVVQPGRRCRASVRRRSSARLAGLHAEQPLPMLDPHPTAHAEIRSARPPGDFEAAVAAATARIGAGEMSKVVLAREVVVERRRPPTIRPPLFGALREQFPACFCFCCGTPEAAFIGASPELLVRRSGASVSTVALAGSTRRSSDPAVDDHLGEQLLRSDKDRREQRIVVRADRPRPAPARGLGRGGGGAGDRQGGEHPAPGDAGDRPAGRAALGDRAGRDAAPDPGRRRRALAERGRARSPSSRSMDRGWYAGPVGWMDATEDGEFCVALRSALLRDREAHLFAGVGVVAGSDPAAELAETEVKLQALLPLLAE